jgi:8-oxo-dGTP pyrophosphatase MutT (NUDIX family)
MSTSLQVVTDEDTFDLPRMRGVEGEYWSFIDKRGYKFSKQHFQQFVRDKLDIDMEIACKYIRKYESLKKSIPTAGAILVHDQSILLIKNCTSPVFSLPKGKSEDGESLLDTAIREVREETGIDLADFVNSETPSISVDKTRFYVINCDSRIKAIPENKFEVVETKWVDIKDIHRSPNLYSKQTLNSLKFLPRKNTC